MKKTITFAAALFISFLSFAQDMTGNMAHISINKQRQLIFSTPKEVNVKYYLLYGKEEGKEFEVVARIPAKGNSVITQHYRYLLQCLPQSEYYLTQVTMNGETLPSKTFTEKQPHIIPEMYKPSNAVASIAK